MYQVNQVETEEEVQQKIFFADGPLSLVLGSLYLTIILQIQRAITL